MTPSPSSRSTPAASSSPPTPPSASTSSSLVNGSVFNRGDLTNDVFNLPIYVPFQDVALLANNQSFQDINIIAGTLASGQTLTLNPIGTVSTANLRLRLPGNFTVRHGATLSVGTGTSVLIDAGRRSPTTGR